MAAFDTERRVRPDRRRRPTPMISRYALLGGRRRAFRRLEEAEGSYVDLHGWGMGVLVLAVLALNLFDGYFTLFYMSHGGQEANPVVDALIQWGQRPFLFIKCAGTGLALSFLVLHKNFRLGRVGLGCALLLYSGILGYHVWLWRDLPSVFPAGS
ncbi:MAG: DUF5658 family protein [Planctomycetota bacterium]